MPATKFEDAPYPNAADETDVNLRVYFDSLSADKLRAVDLTWTDEELRAWDGNFRSDGVLMMVCCNRDVEIDEYREVLTEFLKFRNSTRQ